MVDSTLRERGASAAETSQFMYGDPVYEDLGEMLDGSAGRLMRRNGEHGEEELRGMKRTATDLRAPVERGGRGQIPRGGVWTTMSIAQAEKTPRYAPWIRRNVSQISPSHRGVGLRV
ncbi:hypothetical protein C8J57DRAFT_1234171 [Mycena rebaudengoi]|nr:hypothetical protein C8J57DRAFT_1234171 [Mycena rebaudengoi]